MCVLLLQGRAGTGMENEVAHRNEWTVLALRLQHQMISTSSAFELPIPSITSNAVMRGTENQEWRDDYRLSQLKYCRCVEHSRIYNRRTSLNTKKTHHPLQIPFSARPHPILQSKTYDHLIYLIISQSTIAF